MRLKKVEASNIADLIRIADEVNLSPWSAQNYLDEMKNPASIMYRLADEQNQTVGLVVGRMITGGAVEPKPEAEIYNIAVVESQQRTGLGQVLLDHFLDLVKVQGAEAIWLEVRESNIPAIAFYKKNGFEKVQTRNHFYENPREHGLLMKRTL